MKITKVTWIKFERTVKAFGKGCQFVKIPSSKDNFAFMGLIMSNEAWVAWPDNLTDEEMSLYLDKFGSPPDIFALDPNEKVKITNVIRNSNEDTNEEPKKPC